MLFVYVALLFATALCPPLIVVPLAIVLVRMDRARGRRRREAHQAHLVDIVKTGRAFR